MHAALLVSTLAISSPAVSTSPFELDLELDLQLTLTGVLTSMGPRIVDVTGEPAPWVSPLRTSLLPKIDRNVVGNDSGGARMLSDGLLYGQLALPFAVNFIDMLVTGGKMSDFGAESLILFETAALTTMLTMMTKTAVARPRPYMFDPDASLEMRQSVGANESFFSGHTALAFSMATAYSYMYQKKHPDSPAVIPIWIGTHLAASTVGLMRVEGGRHFWTDVVTGAAVGSAVGFLVPWIHQRRGDDSDGIGFDDLRIVPQISKDYFGLTAMWFF